MNLALPDGLVLPVERRGTPYLGEAGGVQDCRYLRVTAEASDGRRARFSWVGSVGQELRNRRVAAETFTGNPRDIDDTSPWSDAPLMNNAQGPIIYFAMRYSMADEVSAAYAQMAAERGLVCFDVQWNQLRPTVDES